MTPELRAAFGPPAVELVVWGDPAPQGSKTPLGRNPRTGRMMMRESSRKVKPWREAVEDHARVAVGPSWTPLTAPIAYAITFTVPAPGRIPPERLGLPAAYPDASKMLRSTEDALSPRKPTKARPFPWRGVWKDDGLVTDILRVRVRYPGSDAATGVLSAPGAVIGIWTHPLTAPGLP